MKRLSVLSRLWFVLLLLSWVPQAQAVKLKPFILGDTPPGGAVEVVAKTEAALQAQGLRIVGSYAPYPGATVICATNDALIAAAAAAENGGFGVAQRVSVTEVDGKLQLAYVNPAYLGTAYGLGKLEGVSAKLNAALGRTLEFGAKGVEARKLVPGKYHYGMGMPYFHDVTLLNKFNDHDTAVATVEHNLAAGKGGTKKVYRIDLPGKQVSVFGVGIPQGDGPDDGRKDTDKEVMAIIDYQDYRSTAALPYELMVQGKEVIALPGRYRIALHFPDTPMMGKHGFFSIRSSPGGIKKALEAVAGYDKQKGLSASGL